MEPCLPQTKVIDIDFDLHQQMAQNEFLQILQQVLMLLQQELLIQDQ